MYLLLAGIACYFGMDMEILRENLGIARGVNESKKQIKGLMLS